MQVLLCLVSPESLPVGLTLLLFPLIIHLLLNVSKGWIILEIQKCTIYPNVRECCSGDITVPLETWHCKTVACIQVYIEGDGEKRRQQTNSIFFYLFFFIQQQPRSPACHPSLILQSSSIQAEPYKPIDLSLPLIADLYYPPSSRLRFEGLNFSGEEAESSNWRIGAMIDLWAAWRTDHLLSPTFIIPSDLTW